MERTSKKALALALAASAAALLMTGCASMCQEPTEALVKCATQHCKANGQMATPEHHCKMHHHHHHHDKAGFTYTTKGECMARGGNIIE